MRLPGLRIGDQVDHIGRQRSAGNVGERHEDSAGRFSLAAKSLTVAGAAVVTRFGRRRLGAATGGLLLLGGSVCERFAAYHAGFQSARDPQATVEPQRARTAAAAGASPANAALTAG